MSEEAGAIEVSTHPRIADIGEAAWDALLGADPPVFLRYAWFDALEATGCVGPDKGWAPCYLTFRRGDELVAAAPTFIKGHSQGEFVFDHSWARFAEGRLGVEYYPKLVCAVPFTPATGGRLLVKAGADRQALAPAFATALGKLVEAFDLSSAHVLFPRPEEAEELAAAGLVHRHGIQFHWNNAGYETFDDFLARFPSRKRKTIKKERRSLRDKGIVVEALTGDQLTSDIADLAFEFYVSTVTKYFWGHQYLNRAFFEEVCARLGDRLLVLVARDDGGRPLGGAFDLLGDGRLFGRYWGCKVEVPFLHFEVCFYQGIEQCIARGLKVFEPGAGGEHKHARGFDSTVTHSLHFLKHPVLDEAVREFTTRERDGIAAHLEECAAAPLLKPVP